MNIWEELAAIGHYIADNRLRAAWERMVHTATLPTASWCRKSRMTRRTHSFTGNLRSAPKNTPKWSSRLRGKSSGEEMKTAALYLFSFAMFTALVWLGVRAF
jgi:hypothetical protein